MIRCARALAACAVFVACFIHLALAVPAAAPDDSARLRAAAKTLESEAAQAEHTKDGARNPAIFPIAGRSNAADADLQRWMNAQLTTIARERSHLAQARALRQLAGTLRRMATASGPERTPSDSPEMIAQRVLSARQYQGSGDAGQAGAPHESVWERIAMFFGELLGRIVRGIFGAGAASPIVGQIVAIALVALLLVGIAYLAFRIVQALARRPTSAKIDEGMPLPAPIDPDLFYRNGVEAANRGLYAQAVALVFQASLAWFDRQGTLAFDPSLTPIEYRSAVRRARRAASPYFDKLAHAFVLAAFAERPMTQNDWSEADAAYAEMRTVAA